MKRKIYYNLLLLATMFGITSCSQDAEREEFLEGEILISTEIYVDGQLQTRASTEAGYTTGAGSYHSGEGCTVAAYANQGYELESFNSTSEETYKGSSSYTFRVTNPIRFVAKFKKNDMKVGDFYYSDHTFSTELDPNKKCIGVIFFCNSQPKVLSAEYTEVYWANSGSENVIIPEIIKGDDYNKDLDGVGNTAAIVNKLGKEAPAAYWCYNFSTEGTSVHDWHLPAYGEMYTFWEDYELVNRGYTEASRAIMNSLKQLPNHDPKLDQGFLMQIWLSTSWTLGGSGKLATVMNFAKSQVEFVNKSNSTNRTRAVMDIK